LKSEDTRFVYQNSPFFLDASSLITFEVKEDLNISWLTQVKVKGDIPILEKLKEAQLDMLIFVQVCRTIVKNYKSSIGSERTNESNEIYK